MTGRRGRGAGVAVAALVGGLAGVAGLGLAGCAQADGPAGDATELVVAAAASLREPLEAAAAAYEADQPGVAITLTFDSSAALRTRIEQGAPADVFLSADEINPARLAEAGLAAGEPRPFAANGLAIVAPSSGSPVATPRDLALDGIRIIAAGAEVPITRYAAELVDRLAGQPGYPADFVAAYEANVVSREDNVKAVVAKIELGEGDAGIVYRTDAATADVVSLELPPGIDVAVRYTGVVVAGRPALAQASAFLGWLAGADGQAVLAEHGFGPVP